MAPRPLWMKEGYGLATGWEEPLCGRYEVAGKFLMEHGTLWKEIDTWSPISLREEGEEVGCRAFPKVAHRLEVSVAGDRLVGVH